MKADITTDLKLTISAIRWRKVKEMKKVQEIYKKLDDMNLSMLARSVINTTDQYGILLFDGLDEIEVEMLCEEIANDD